MSQTWLNDDETINLGRISPIGWLRVLIRGLILGTIVFCGLILLLIVRLIEVPIFGLHRPVTPYITQAVCRSAFVILGIGFSVQGEQMKQPGAIVANHSSWLDIFALNARKRIYFVSKSEVAKWPGIGWLAKATGTVFINRNPREAKAQTEVFQTRLKAGHKLLFFPEGTSTDGLRVLPFKSTLFASFFAPELKGLLSVQAVTVVYYAPVGEDKRFYGWWGDMDFGTHLLHTLAAPRQGRVELIYHRPIAIRDAGNRKELAAMLETQVRSTHPLAIENEAGR